MIDNSLNYLRYYLFCFLLICSFSHFGYGNELTRQATIEIEETAEQKGKIWNGEAIRHSIKLYLNASENWEKLGDLKRASYCLRESVKLSFLVSEYDHSLKRLEKALGLDYKTNNLEGQIITHNLLFLIHKFNNQNNKSKFHINEALRLSESSTSYSKAYSHFIVGRNMLHSGDIKSSKTSLATAYGYIEKEENHVKLKAFILLNLGILSVIEGDKSEALKRITDAEELWKSVHYTRGSALVANSLGFVYLMTDEKQSAMEFYRQADNLIPESVDYEERAKMYSGIAAIYFHYRYYESAEKNYQLALQWQKKAKWIVGQLGVLNELGQTQYLRGKIAESKLTLEKVLILSQKIESSFFSGQINLQYGLFALSEGNIDTAIEEIKKARLSFHELGIFNPRIDNILGSAFKRKKDFASSHKYFKAAAVNSRKMKDTVQLAQALHGIASILKLDGKIEDAFSKSKESIEVTESISNDVENNNLRESFFSSSFERYDIYINLLMAMHKIYPNKEFDLLALQASEKSRSRLMRENLQLVLKNIRVDADPILVEKEQKLIRDLTDTMEKLYRISAEKRSQEDVDNLNLQITRIKDELQKIKALLKRDSPIYDAIKNPVEFDVGGLQRDILDEQTVLLEFFFGKEKSYVWLIEKNQINVFTLPKSGLIENKIDNLFKLLVSTEELPQDDVLENTKQQSQVEASYEAKAKDVSKILFGQFSDKLKGKRMIIVPDGKLRSFPISALPIPDSDETKPFLLTNEIVYEPSASLLYLLKTERKKQNSPKKDFLVFSDPIFDRDDQRLVEQIETLGQNSSVNDESAFWTDFDSMNDLEKLKRLKGSESESKNIFRYYDESNSKILPGFAANRSNLLSENLRDYKVVHFATHGLSNEEQPELSGIVLSRFDENGNSRNGMIWLEDIYGLKLLTDLVVLSACDTGAGKEIKGEGLKGLTSGFLQTGAKSIISSHWKVDDDRTSELMEDFYKFLSEENITSSKALQKAKIKMYNNPNYRFPLHWASFTFHGDFQNKPNLKTRFSYYNYLIVIFSIFALFIAFSVKRRMGK